MSIYGAVINQSLTSLDLQSQIEELNVKLKEEKALTKDKEYKFFLKIDEYEASVQRLQEENRQSKEKYEKLFDAHRKLQKNDNILEEKLLTIVEKYETEIKFLKNELNETQTKLVEAKLIINDLEHEKQRYKQDCNLAVSLLQCKPSEFVTHSINTLPINLKERLNHYLPEEEIQKLENAANLEKENEKKNLQKNSIFKIPIFQPTAAAAIMYNMQSNCVKQSRDIENHALNIKSNRSISLEQNSYISQSTSTSSLNSNDLSMNKDSIDTAKVPTTLIAQILKKDNETRPRLFPYVCKKCKKDIWSCDTSSQTYFHDDDGKVLYANSELNNLSSTNTSPNRSKSIENNLFIHKSNTVINLFNENENESKNTHFKSKSRNKLDSWTDLDLDSINYK